MRGASAWHVLLLGAWIALCLWSRMVVDACIGAISVAEINALYE
jgi:hypothetical protein